tara:strand:+ start:576 stop:1040 length:465 start_codon:yes stop_codon:yes gene_type:complete
MAIINSYPTATPTTGDLLIGTDTSTTPNSTKTFTVSSISALVNKGYKSLIAKWSQGSTSTPVLDTPIVNDTGLTFSFDAYSSVGVYDLKPSVNFTDVSKIYAVVSSYADEAGVARLISIKEINEAYVRISNISVATQALANGVQNGQIEIRIYE